MIDRCLAVLLIGLCLLPLGRADEAQQTFDKLYQDAQQDMQQTRAIDEQREKRYLAAKDKQQAQWQEIKLQLDQEHRREDQLKKQFTANKTKLDQLRSQVENRSASLSTFFASVRQAAGETTGVLHESLISAQYPGRDEISDKLADNSVVPSVAQVEQLWRIMQQELAESGKVVRFKAPVMESAHQEQRRMVTRVGAFDLLADGRYLEYLPDNRKLSAIGNYVDTNTRKASDLEDAVTGYHVVGIDPSAGVKLSLIMQARDFAAGVTQGHTVGLLSLGFGLVGLLVPIGAGRTRYLRSIVASTLFTFGIVMLMTNMFKVFFGDLSQPVSYAEVEIVRPVIKQNAEAVKQDVLPEKPHPEVLPVPQQVVLQQANLLPSVPSLTSIPTVSSDMHLIGGAMLGKMASSKMGFDNEVTPLVQIPPLYPYRAEMMHIGGMVILEFTINELGRAINPIVVKSEPPKIFDQAAIKAILSWRFKPKLIDGQPVARLARQRFDFRPRN